MENTRNEEMICIECGNKIEKASSLDYLLCKSCLKRKSDELKQIWISDVLKYPLYGIEEFLPSFPAKLIDAALKDYLVDESIQAKINEYFNSHPDKRYSSLNLQAIAQSEKDKLEISLFEPHERSCTKCGTQYQADSIWKYNICIKCAESESYEWQRFYINEILGYDEEYVGILPAPRLPIDKYLLKKDELEFREKMNQKTASRIQVHADKNNTNQDFKARAQAAAARNNA